jgi:hypothetical protein
VALPFLKAHLANFLSAPRRRRDSFMSAGEASLDAVIEPNRLCDLNHTLEIEPFLLSQHPTGRNG